jgi:hypothetical protein
LLDQNNLSLLLFGMEKLSDFKPLKRVVLPGMGELDCAGLTVIVGANSSGKSQLLRDIQRRILGEARELVVATELEIELPDHESFVKCLMDEEQLGSFFDDSNNEQLVSKTPVVGMGLPAQIIPVAEATRHHKAAKKLTERTRKNDYFRWSGQFLVTGLFLENRLRAMETVSNIDYQAEPPKGDLHALYKSEGARIAFTAEVVRAFSVAVWADITKGISLCLRVARSDALPSAEDRHSIEKMSKFRTIEDEGDGMKSYVATCVSVLLGRRPVNVIDEPEMCLHPPQAYNLGQFIGNHAASTETATFVATHSSQVLRGVIQTAENLKIVRLSKNENGFHAKQVNSGILAEAMKKPTVRAETVLDGIFSQAVTIIEGDGDRIVYQATWEKVGENLNFDIHFTAVGGIGGIADTCQLYRVLGIPVAVIADLDLITDTTKIEQILDILCGDPTIVTELLQRIHKIAKAIRLLPPTISEEDAIAKLKLFAGQTYNWDGGDDKALRSELNDLSNSLNGMRDFKDGGLRNLPAEIRDPLKILLDDLERLGIFLVRYGELEDWLYGCGIKESKKRNKWAWANEAAHYIRENEPQQDDIWDFVRRLGDSLTTQVHEIAGAELEEVKTPDSDPKGVTTSAP